MFVASADLLEKMKQTTGLQWIGSTKSMATFLSKLDLVSRRDPAGKLRGYLLTKEILEDIKLRYMPSIPPSLKRQKCQRAILGAARRTIYEVSEGGGSDTLQKARKPAWE